jgi:hypothetical protein
LFRVSSNGVIIYQQFQCISVCGVGVINVSGISLIGIVTGVCTVGSLSGVESSIVELLGDFICESVQSVLILSKVVCSTHRLNRSPGPYADRHMTLNLRLTLHQTSETLTAF